jgi:GxxExxY protein
MCLAYELQHSGLAVETETLLPVVYHEVTIDAGYRIDLLVERRVIVELKALAELLPIHDAQIMACLKLSRVKVGLLINFNVAHLCDGIRRRILG